MTTQGGVIDEREFTAIIGNGQAGVNVTVGMNVPFGDAKVSVSVRLTCNQDEATIDRAGFIAYKKALDMCQDGLMIAAKERAALLGSLPSTRG